MKLAPVALALLLAGCATRPLISIGGKAPPPTPPAAQAPPKPVCTPDQAAPVDPVPDPESAAYAGLRFIQPFANDPEELKLGARMLLAFVHDLTDYANKAHDRLQRTADGCTPTR